MRLADYIEQNAIAIVDAAEAFAETHRPDGVHLDREALRDHLPQILAAVVDDLRQSQSVGNELARAEGDRDTPPGHPSAAQTHGRLRAKAGYDINQLVAEYRSLRASVLRTWDEPASAESFADMHRFNQAIDQAIAESVAHFSAEAEAWRQIFLGVLGHDLRGPLTAILLTSEIMAAMTLDAPLSRQMERLIVSGRRMSALLDDLLDFSRTSFGMGIRVTRCETDLTAEIAEEIDMLRSAWPGRSIAFQATPVEGMFDASRLREALANLVNNAAKYGNAQGELTVTLARVDGQVRLTVSNPGATISEATLATMFEPLRRGVHAHEDGASLGLGLFVVREIAKAHGGDVLVDSTDGNTTFAITLPLGADKDGGSQA